MMIELLTVPDCPNRTVARERIAAALARSDRHATVRERVIDTHDDAVTSGMQGSPTILINGVDPFANGSHAPSISCRLYAVDGGVDGSPSIDQLVGAVLAG